MWEALPLKDDISAENPNGQDVGNDTLAAHVKAVSIRQWRLLDDISPENPSGQEVGNDMLAAHVKAVSNVKKFLSVFLIFDLMVVVTYGYQTFQTFMDVDDDDSNRVGLGQILTGMVALIFTCDVVLASALLSSMIRRSDGSLPSMRWEDHYQLIFMNWACNISSLAVLACQRFFHAHSDKYLMAAALLYVILRAVKLRPLGQLNREVAYARSHPDESDRYAGLLATWAAKQDSRVGKCMLTSILVGVAAIVITLALACLYDVLASRAPTSPVVPPRRLNALEDAANGAAVGGAFGFCAGAVVGPEGIPVGAAVGGAVGAVGGFAFSFFH